MFDIFFNHIKSYLIEVGFETKDSVKGGREEDIVITEKKISQVLPTAYREWLKVFGLRMSKTLFDGDCITINTLLEASKEADENSYDIIDYQDALFINYEDTSESYIVLRSGSFLDDPRVFGFIADDELFQVGNTFTSWVRESIIKMMKILNHLKRMSFDKEWLDIDSFYTGVNDAQTIEYNRQREAFISTMEKKDHESGIITMPDDFQKEWISYMENNGMNEYINWKK